MRNVIVITDATTYEGSPQLDSATAKFTWRDKGRAIIDKGQAKIPPGTYIKDVLGPGTIILTRLALAAGTGVTVLFHRFTFTLAVADAVKTDGLHVVTSPTAQFNDMDDGALVTGAGIPGDTYVQSHGDGTLYLTNPVTGSGTFTLTINRWEPEPMWEFDMLLDKISDSARDEARNAQRATGLTVGGVNDIMTRLETLMEDYAVADSDHRPVVALDMKDAPFPTGDGATAMTALVAGGSSVTGSLYE